MTFLVLLPVLAAAVPTSQAAVAVAACGSEFTDDPAWSRTSGGEVSGGLLRILPAGGVDDGFDWACPVGGAYTIEWRTRLVSGGNNYIAPGLRMGFADGGEAFVNVLPDPGSNSQPGIHQWGWRAFTWQPYIPYPVATAGQWMEFQARVDGSTVFISSRLDPTGEWQPAVNASFSGAPLATLRIQQPWDASIEVDHIRVARNVANAGFERGDATAEDWPGVDESAGIRDCTTSRTGACSLRLLHRSGGSESIQVLSGPFPAEMTLSFDYLNPLGGNDGNKHFAAMLYFLDASGQDLHQETRFDNHDPIASWVRVQLPFIAVPANAAFAVVEFNTQNGNGAYDGDDWASWVDDVALLAKTPLSPRYHVATFYDAAAGVAYGLGGGNGFDEIVRLDPENGASMIVARFPSILEGTCVAWDPVDRMAYAFHGWTHSSHSSQIFGFDPDTATLSLLGSAPYGNSHCAAVWDPVGRVAYIFGGDAVSMLPTIARYDPSTGQYAVLPATLPFGRAYAAAVWDRATGTALIFGGQGPTLGDETDEIVRFDPAAMTTSVVGHLPFPMGATAAVTRGPLAYLLGGHLGDGASTGSIIRVDVASAEAREFPAELAPVAFAGAFLANDGYGYLVGGNTAPSALVRVSLPTVLPGGIADVEAIPGVRNITLSWSAAPEATSYVVYRDSGDGLVPWRSVTATNVVDESLANGEGAQYAIQARNADGDGPISAHVDASAFDVPGTPLLLAEASIRAVTLRWTAPSADGGTPITGYRLSRSGAIIAEIEALEYFDAPLADDTAYEYTITAVNAAGEGEASGPATARTPDLDILLLDRVQASREAQLAAIESLRAQLDAAESRLRVDVGGTRDAILSDNAATRLEVQRQGSSILVGLDVLRDAVLAGIRSDGELTREQTRRLADETRVTMQDEGSATRSHMTSIADALAARLSRHDTDQDAQHADIRDRSTLDHILTRETVNATRGEIWNQTSKILDRLDALRDMVVATIEQDGASTRAHVTTEVAASETAIRGDLLAVRDQILQTTAAKALDVEIELDARQPGASSVTGFVLVSREGRPIATNNTSVLSSTVDGAAGSVSFTSMGKHGLWRITVTAPPSATHALVVEASHGGLTGAGMTIVPRALL